MEARSVRVLQYFGISIAIILIGLTLGADAIGIGDGEFGRTQGLLLGVGLISLLASIAGRRSGQLYVQAVVILANTMLFLIVTEIAAGSVRQLLRAGDEPLDARGSMRRSAGVSYYADQEWGRRYWQEQQRIDQARRYAPFRLWQGAAFAGRYITVDDEGQRVTPGADCREGAYRVFLFGGSAAWGTGSPDWGTIPAWLQQSMGGLGRPVCVRNFGQNAYVSSQDLLSLIAALQKDEVPDLAIFYQGFNDAYAASIYKQAGVHLNLDGIARRLEAPQQTSGQWLRETVKSSQIVLLADQVRRSLRRSPPATTRATVFATPVDSLADAVVLAWLANYRSARSLAREYGFDIAFFWQPALLAGAKTLTGEEQGMATAAEGMRPLTRAVYDRIESLAPSLVDVHYLGHVFDDEASLTWIDFVHVTPEANRRVAARILETLPVH